MVENSITKMDEPKKPGVKVENMPELQPAIKAVKKTTLGYDPNTSPQNEGTTTRRKMPPLLRSES